MRSTLLRFAALSALVLSASGCHLDMWNQRRYEPLEAGDFFGEGESSARTFVAGTVSYKMPRLDDHLYAGTVDGEFAETLPEAIELTRALLERGQERFNIYCMVCHGETGHGDGMIPKRGFPRPPSYHEPRLLESPIGYFYDVMTNGFGRMFSYASRVNTEDRWAIAAYIRVLQLSQNATPDLLPPDILLQAKNSSGAGAHEEPAVEPGNEEGEH